MVTVLSPCAVQMMDGLTPVTSGVGPEVLEQLKKNANASAYGRMGGV
jgi:hypothetical protein